MSEERLRIAMPAERSEVASVLGAFSDLCSRLGVDDEARRVVSLALDDLLTNVVSYGFPDGGSHTVDVDVGVHADRITVEIRDAGIAFNPFDRPAPDTTAPLEDRKVGGLGIHLVQELLDEARYERIDGQNVVSLTKHLP